MKHWLKSKNTKAKIHTLLILAILLIVVDLFFASDILTHVAYVLLCVIVARLLPIHLLYKILFAVLVWFGLVAMHYTVWKHLVQKVANRIIAPDRYLTGSDGLVGLVGEIKEIEGAKVIELKGDLSKFACVAEIKPGDKVKVESVRHGVLQVAPIE